MAHVHTRGNDDFAEKQTILHGLNGRRRTAADGYLAEREGFEPPIRLPVRRISSAVLSTTQPPLQVIDIIYILLDSVNAPNAIATEIATESSSFGL